MPLLSALLFCLAFFSAYSVAENAMVIAFKAPEIDVTTAFYWLTEFAYTMSFLLLLLIGRSDALRPGSEVGHVPKGSEEYLNSADQARARY